MRGIRQILIPGILFLLLLSCHKRYEEDDRKYLKTPCERIAKRWQLYKITNASEAEYTDSVYYYRTSDNNWAVSADQSYTYDGLIIELERSDNNLCLETGIRGKAKILNKPFSSGYYEIRNKRTTLKFDLRMNENSSSRYFIDDYTIRKMTSDELIFSNYKTKAYFRAVD